MRRSTPLSANFYSGTNTRVRGITLMLVINAINMLLTDGVKTLTII